MKMRFKLREISDSLHRKSFIMAAYNQRNIIIFENNSLFILCGFTQRSGKAEYIRNVKIELSPPLPPDVLITAMAVVNNGTMVAMWGPKGIFIVRMNSDISSLGDNYQAVKSDYFCECQAVHASIFLSTRSPTVFDVKWVPQTESYHSNHLAVLFSDNCIRIYSMDKPVDFPSVKIDYSSLLLTGEEVSSSSLTNTYGLFKSIVSFDFVTPINEHPVVMAIDFEGEMYSSVVDLTGFSTPFTRPLISPASLPCNPIQIKTIQHPLSNVFSILTVVSTGKLLSHIIAVPGENASYELFLHDQLQLPSDAHQNAYMWDSGRNGAYLVSTHMRLYYVDILKWIGDYRIAIEASTSGVSTSVTSETRVHELFTRLDYCKEEDSGFCCIKQIAVVTCTTEVDDETVTLFIANTDNPPLVTAFMRFDSIRFGPPIASEVAGESLGTKNVSFQTELEGIIARKKALPTIICNESLSEETLLSGLQSYTAAFANNLKVDKDALQLALKRVIDMQSEAEILVEKKRVINQRLLEVFDHFLDIKNRLAKSAKTIEASHRRIDTLTSRLSGKLPLNSFETKVLNTLKDYRRQMQTYSIKIPQLSLEVSETRRSAFGPAKAFHASAGARKFVLSKSSQEISCLVRRVETLDEQLNKLNLRTTET